jgi:hypothetical protein
VVASVAIEGALVSPLMSLARLEVLLLLAGEVARLAAFEGFNSTSSGWKSGNLSKEAVMVMTIG